MRWLCFVMVGAIGSACSSRSSKEHVFVETGGSAGQMASGGSAGSTSASGGSGNTSAGGTSASGGTGGAANTTGGTAGANAAGASAAGSSGAGGSGGTAGASGCTPVDETGPFLFGGQTKPTRIAVDSQYVYWLNETATGIDLQRGPKGGGCPETLRANAIAFPSNGEPYVSQDMFVDSDGVFIASTDKARALVKLNKETGADIFTAECLSAGTGIMGHNTTHVYYGCTDNDSEIVAVAKSNGAPRSNWTFDIPAGQPTISGITVSSSFVYFVFGGNAVARVPLTGGTGHTQITPPPAFKRVSFGSQLYAIAPNQVYSMQEGSGATPVTALVGAIDVIATEETAFVLQHSEGKSSILRLSTPKTYNVDVAAPGGFALDGTYLYITDKNPGVISRIQR